MRAPPSALRVLPFVIGLGALLLAVANFSTIFELTPPGGEAQQELSAVDRHSYALLILAIFALAALFVAISTGSRPAAVALAVCGAVALLLFLLRDLREVGTIGLISDELRFFANAEAVPQAGFWLEALGSVALAGGGGAFAMIFRPDERAEEAADAGSTRSSRQPARRSRD